MVRRLDNCVGTGVHVTPAGIEFDEQVVALGPNVALRGAAGIQFPRQLPVEEGRNPLNLNVSRLGLKSRW